jgi:hypothetical protein
MKKKKSKYFDGPSGVYYNAGQDSVYVLWRLPSTEIINMKTGERIGGVYELERGMRAKDHYRRISVLATAPLTYLGAL